MQRLTSRRSIFLATLLLGLFSLATPTMAQPTDYEELEQEESKKPEKKEDSSSSQGSKAESGGGGDDGVASNVKKEEVEPSFKAGTVDLLLTGGFADFLYLHIEPGLDIGLIPLPAHLSISLGAAADIGYCVLCAGFNLVSPDLQIESYYITFFGRAALHLGAIASFLEMPELDPFIGIMAGPTTFQYRFTLNGSEQTTSQWAFSGGINAGVRYAFDSTWILFAEWRYLATIGYNNVGVTLDGQRFEADDRYARVGQDYVLGVGVRF